MAGPVNITVWQFVVAVAAASLATFLGTFTVESLKNNSRLKKQITDYRIQLRIELEQLSKTIERLKTEFKSSKFFPLTFIALANQQTSRIDERLKRSTLIPNREIQRKLFEIVTETSILLVEMDAMERWPLEKGITGEEEKKRLDTAREQRIEKSVELSDLTRRLDDIIKKI